MASSIGTVINTVWSLIFIAPLYIVLSTILCRTLLYVYQLARTKSSFIYRYLGDITWAFPFTVKKEKTIHKLLSQTVFAIICYFVWIECFNWVQPNLDHFNGSGISSSITARSWIHDVFELRRRKISEIKEITSWRNQTGNSLNWTAELMLTQRVIALPCVFTNFIPLTVLNSSKW